MAVSAILFAASTLASAKQQEQAGKAQKSAYDFQAKQAEMEATANITDRTRALNEAMAVQNAMVGGSGRTLESIQSVIGGDKKRYEQDVALIKTGTDVKASQYRGAGKAAKSTADVNAASTLAQGVYKYSMLGG